MSIETDDRTARLTGVLLVEEVEVLAAWLRTTDQPTVDLSGCTHLHSGALQALLVFQPKISEPPADPFLAQHVLPLLDPETAAAVVAPEQVALRETDQQPGGEV